ncbi:MAG: putative DNA modification/repair radical SAM protein [Actinomycetia bacterium]|nr:putative DNA modification/repair radical SAM protein [Actinomycetes bacterium]
MDLQSKLEVLTSAAKYDVACTSSGVDRAAKDGSLGDAQSCGICHSFSADGRCIALLKVLMTNECIYDCQYCVNRASNETTRTTFTPQELAELTIEFYRRNFIEGLFLSSGVIKSPDYAMERMCQAISILRDEYRFRGYIHAKAIPGASTESIDRLGLLADRISVNIELPSQEGLKKLAPDKHKTSILGPMSHIRDGISQNKSDLVRYRRAPKFAPAGQSTQMIIGATPDSDFQILRLTSSLYQTYQLKRVFFSAYVPVSDSALLPQTNAVPFLREHRLYQADWLLRFYQFDVDEIINEEEPFLDPYLDPKCNWAMNHLDQFPLEVNKAEYEMLLRVPGIGVEGAKRIVRARRTQKLGFDHLKKLRIVLKRAQYFITCSGSFEADTPFARANIYEKLTTNANKQRGFREVMQAQNASQQLTLFDSSIYLPSREDVQKSLTGQL